MGIKKIRRGKVKPLFKVILRSGMTKNLKTCMTKNLKTCIGFGAFVLLRATSELYKSAIH
jgi:hypothetical protein